MRPGTQLVAVLSPECLQFPSSFMAVKRSLCGHSAMPSVCPKLPTSSCWYGLPTPHLCLLCLLTADTV